MAASFKIWGFLFRPNSSLIALSNHPNCVSLAKSRICNCLPWDEWSSPNLVRIAQNFFTAGFDSGQPRRCQNIFQLNSLYTTSRFFIYILYKNGSLGQYNYAQFDCFRSRLVISLFQNLSQNFVWVASVRVVPL